MFNQTNLTELSLQPVMTFDNSAQLRMQMLNGTGDLTGSYINSFCRVEGLDQVLMFEIGIFIISVLILFVLTFYVSMYTLRWINND